jgi:hypothetical protein
MRAMMDELALTIARRQVQVRADVQLPQAADQMKKLIQLKSELERIQVHDNLLQDTAEETSDVRKIALAGSLVAVLGIIIARLSPILWLDITGGVFLGAGIFLVAGGLIWRRSSVLRDFRQRLEDSQQEFRDRLDFEFGKIFDRLFQEVRRALTESLVRLDRHGSINAPLLDEAFQIGEAASDMVIVSQRLLGTQESEQPSVAA